MSNQLLNVDNNSRVVFKRGYQKKLLYKVKEFLEEFDENWVVLLSKILGKNQSSVYNHINEKFFMNIRDIKSLLNLVPILNENEIVTKIEKILEPNWGAKRGAFVTNKKYKKQLSKWGRKGAEELKRRYDESKRRSWRQSGIFKGGLISAERQKLTSTEQRLLKSYKKLFNFQIEVHKTFKIKNVSRNIDFVFSKNNEKIIIETSGSIRSKSESFFKILEAMEKREFLRKKYKIKEFFLHFKSKFRPLDTLLLAIEKDFIPTVDIKKHFQILNETIKRKSLEGCLIKLRQKYKSEIEQNLEKMKAAALREKYKTPNPTETLVNELLQVSNLNPNGKTLLKTKYGTFTVVDNFFVLNNVKWYVCVSKSKRGLREILRNHIGYSFMIREIVDKKAKIMSIILLEEDRNVIGKTKKLCDKWIDKLIILHPKDIKFTKKKPLNLKDLREIK